MRAFHQASAADQLPIGKVSRVTATIVVALAMLASQAVYASAGTLVPAAETGGSGGGGHSVSDMIRGDYSPVDANVEIAVTEIDAQVSVAEMIRGVLSPVDAPPEIAVTSSQSVADQLRGDLSLISIGDA